MDDRVVFIACPKTVEWIQEELMGKGYQQQTQDASKLLAYTDNRVEDILIYVPKRVYDKLHKDVKDNYGAEKAVEFSSYLETVEMESGATLYSEVATLAGLLKTKGHEKIIFVCELPISESKTAMLKSGGIKEIFNLEQAGKYIMDKPEMQKLVELAQIGESC
jgi:hypothetical protein